MIRDDGQRAILLELDTAIQRLGGDSTANPGHLSLLPLTGVYHNLLRQWAEFSPQPGHHSREIAAHVRPDVCSSQ